MKITSNQLREKYLEFFKSKKHNIIKSASLIPENDSSVLFTTAGMHPLVPYLLGKEHPAGKRLVDIQKCIRTGDIDDLGDNRHLTFFEMLGNWSLGDYFKRDSINWSFEFLTDKKIGLGLDPNRLYFTVFKGEKGIPRDEESIQIWQEILNKHNLPSGVSIDNTITKNVKIIPLGVEDNFWIAGNVGPCGGDTEIFYDTRPKDGELVGDFESLVKSFRLIEIWNNVFMEFKKTEDGKYEKLDKKNVDTGMGLERTLAVLNNVKTVFETDVFEDAIKKLEEISFKKYQDNLKAFRVIIDHTRAATFILGDDKNIIPSNKDQGYILRRLIRRSVRFGKQLEISEQNIFTSELAKIYIKNYQDFYPELAKNSNRIIEELKKEELKFKETLENGLKEIDKLFDKYQKENNNSSEFTLNSDYLFNLYTTFGFPIEMTFEEVDKKRKTPVPEDIKNMLLEQFSNKMKQHQELSRQGAEEKFKGGLADHGEISTKYHTTTHLLHASLKEILGDHVEQRGSNITSERMRFDFSHQDKMTDEEKKKVEELVNYAITQKYPISFKETSVEEAKKEGAIGLFENKYAEKVKVYTVGDPNGFPKAAKDSKTFSKEICGGPHVENTSELGHFKIIKEESSSSGVRRIKAILE